MVDGINLETGKETYFASLNVYVYMAHYVAQVLKLRPNRILDTWGVAELLVAFGTYKNEESYKNFLEWKALSQESKRKIKKPQEFAVLFYTVDDLNEEGGGE